MYFPVLDNLADGDLIHQRFVLVTGSISSLDGLKESASPYITVDTPSFPSQTFPISPKTGAWKALVHLQPGPQTVSFTLNGNAGATLVVSNVSYLPLLHVAPLHLAIMVAKDSPQWMDCPPDKAASPSHRDLAAAIKKMRMSVFVHPQPKSLNDACF